MLYNRNILSISTVLALIAPTLVVPIPLWHHHTHECACTAPCSAASTSVAPTHAHAQPAATHDDCPLCLTATVVHPTPGQAVVVSVPLNATKATPVATLPNDYAPIRPCRARGPPPLSTGV